MVWVAHRIKGGLENQVGNGGSSQGISRGLENSGRKKSDLDSTAETKTSKYF